jgi:hypothetical protein
VNQTKKTYTDNKNMNQHSAFKSSIRIKIVKNCKVLYCIPKMHNIFTSEEEAAKAGK